MAKNKNESNNNQNPNPNPNQNQKTNETETKNEEVVTEKEVVAEEKKDNGGGEKKNKDSNSVTAVYKIRLHGKACARRVMRRFRRHEGDPTKLRDKLSQKTKKNVELVYPLPPKDNKAAAVDDKKPDKKPKENKNQSSNNNRKVVAEEKKDNGGGEKKNEDSNSVTAVYKIGMHCEGCSTKIKRCTKDFQGVEIVKAEVALNKLTVVGKVDPIKLRDMLSQKTTKHVEIVPPIPKKEKDGGGSSREDIDKKDGNGGGSAGGKKGGGGDGGQEEGGDGGGGEKRMDVFRHPGFGYYDHGYGYGNGFVNGYGHANGWEWECICAWILRTLYPWVDPWVGTCNMHQICSVKKTQMLALSCEEGKTVF